MSAGLELRIKNAKAAIKEAEYLIIGGGAGISEAAGLSYSGKRFTDNFGDFISDYGIEDMYSGTFYPFKTQEEKWAFWSRVIMLNRFNAQAGKIYLDLRKLVDNKKYFIITTNVDGQFDKAGFPAEQIFAVQGDYGKIQCSAACHKKLYSNEENVKAMVSRQKACRIPSELIPKCPVCGKNMEVNVRKDGFFIQDSGWHQSSERFEDFTRKASGHRIALIEIGVGFNTPGIIRFPFEQIAYEEPQAALIRINRDYAGPIKENELKTISFSESAEEIVSILSEN